MADDHEAFESQRLHQCHLIRSHDAFRIIGRAVGGGWFVAISVAAKIRGDDRERLCELLGDLVPDDVRLWMTVEQQQARPLPARSTVDAYPAKVDTSGFESAKHSQSELRRLGPRDDENCAHAEYNRLNGQGRCRDADDQRDGENGKDGQDARCLGAATDRAIALPVIDQRPEGAVSDEPRMESVG